MRCSQPKIPIGRPNQAGMPLKCTKMYQKVTIDLLPISRLRINLTNCLNIPSLVNIRTCLKILNIYMGSQTWQFLQRNVCQGPGHTCLDSWHTFLYENWQVWNPISSRICNRCYMYLLTEWEGQRGKYLAQGQGVWTECSEVRAS